MSTALYPDDCSDACSKRAVWDIKFRYPPAGVGDVRHGRMGACEDHKKSVTKAAGHMSWRAEVNVARKS